MPRGKCKHGNWAPVCNQCVRETEQARFRSTDWLSVGESLGRAKDGLQEILCAIRLPQNREQFIKNNWGVLVDMADRLWEENFSDNSQLSDPKGSD